MTKQKRPEDYRAKLADGEKASDQFRALLRDAKAGSAARDDAFQSLGKTCAACHKPYRSSTNRLNRRRDSP